jgi:hypothetical protein
LAEIVEDPIELNDKSREEEEEEMKRLVNWVWDGD